MAEPTVFKLSDNRKNSYGFILLSSGCKTERFNDNPVMLYNHDPKCVLGKWNNLKVGEQEITAEPEFDAGDPEALKIKKKVDSGYLKGASIGADILEATMEYPGLEGVLVATSWELVEGSLTSLPSNSKALKLSYRGEELKPETLPVFLSQFNPNNPNKTSNQMKNLTLIAAAIGLAMTATEDEILNGVKTLSAKNTSLEGEIKKLKDEKTALIKLNAENLIDSAITAGKILKTEREHYVELAVGNYDTTKKIVDSLKAHQPFSASLNNGQSSNKYEGWDFKRLQKEAPAELSRIRENEPEKYQQLLKEAYPSVK